MTFKCRIKRPAVTRHGGDDAELKTRHLRPTVSPQRYPRSAIPGPGP